MSFYHRQIFSILSIFFIISLLDCSGRDKYNLNSHSGNYPFMPDTQVRNVILYIGDGMGMSQIRATSIRTKGANGRLEIEKMPVLGLTTTQSSDQLITDSGAGATALATGYKTRNGMISVTPDSIPVKTILETVRDKGLSTGLVATSTITHATPACFAAHWPDRADQDIIAAQMLDSKVNVILGGGREYFIPKAIEGSKRSDDINLIAKAKNMGYEFVDSFSKLKNSNQNYLLGLFELGALPRNSQEPSLVDLTAKAIEILQRNEKGFFLMVEGSQIDWGGHDNELEYLINEVLQFDAAVKSGIDYALKDKHTLILVTADHETGGMHVKQGPIEGKDIEVTWLGGGHTGEPVPIFAFGPFAHRFTGLIDNTDVPKILADIWYIKDFPRKLN
jgi:alkaline phosphatase